MYWNHRVVKREEGTEPWLEVREVYYEDDGKPMGHADICTGSETLEGLREHFGRMVEAIDTAIRIGEGAVLTKEHFAKEKADAVR